MVTIDHLLGGSASLKEAAEALIEDPLAFFDMSYTKMQTVPRGLLDELQKEALSMRFEQQRDRIPTLTKMANRQGIESVNEFNDVLPVMFEHTVYKSYPPYLLEQRQFDKLTTWMNRLTSHDLSGVDASQCDSIHSWLDLLCEETELDPISSSGTSGTMSFTPNDKSDWRIRVLGSFRIQLVQKFGEAATDRDLNDPIHVLWPTHPNGHTALYRSGVYFHKYLAMGRDDHFHAMFEDDGDTDLMYLAAKIRHAQSRGSSLLDVPQTLLDRRNEIGAMEQARPEKVQAWVDTLASGLAGKRVFLKGLATLIYEPCALGLKQGKVCNFAPDSVMQYGLGGKGIALPDDWEEVIRGFMNYDGHYNYFYGFSEHTSQAVSCEYQRCHLPPWEIPYILDGETSKALPREGVQSGRGAFFDLAINGVWGGLITGDRVEIDWNPCPCGRTTAHLSETVTRFGVDEGGSDKISCTATPEAHDEALDFLTNL